MFYHALIGKGGDTPTEDLSPMLLWENPSPTSEFTAQTVSLDLSNYAGVIIEYEKDYNGIFGGRLYCKKNDDYARVGVGYIEGTVNYSRKVTNVDNTGVTFDSAYNNDKVNSGTTHIPVRIYGVKEYVVEHEEATEFVNSSDTKITCNIGDIIVLGGGSLINTMDTLVTSGATQLTFYKQVDTSITSYIEVIKATSETVNLVGNYPYSIIK